MDGYRLQDWFIWYLFGFWQVVYKNNDIRLELSRLARIGDTKMKIYGEVVFKCENVATLDPINFETPEAYISLPKWNTKRMGSISFDFRTTEPNGLILFTHGKPQERKDARSQKNTKVDFFAVELLDGNLYLLLDMGSGTIKVKATQKKANDGEWYHVDIQRDGRSGRKRQGVLLRREESHSFSVCFPAFYFNLCTCILVDLFAVLFNGCSKIMFLNKTPVSLMAHIHLLIAPVTHCTIV